MNNEQYPFHYAMASVVFLAAPFLFEFDGLARLFFLINGGLVLGAALLTNDRPVDTKLSLN